MRLHLLMRYVWLLIPTSHLLHLSSQKCLRIATARAHETSQDLVCRLLLEKKKKIYLYNIAICVYPLATYTTFTEGLISAIETLSKLKVLSRTAYYIYLMHKSQV